MAELRVRASASASITRLMARLEAGKLAEMEVAMQRVTLENLEGHYSRFMDAHLTLVSHGEEGELDAHTTLFEEVEDKYSNVKAMLTSAIDSTVMQERQGSVICVRGQRIESDEIRLEKIVIPEFHGELNRWVAFRGMFEAMVHAQGHQSTASKYTRLMKALKGTAAQVVAGFLPTDDNYESAWQTLKARYDNSKLIVSAHLNVSLNMEALDKESNTGLRQMIDLTNETTRSLAAMKRPVDTWDDILVHILVSKLPKATIIHWEMEQRGTELPRLADLLTFIEGRARCLDHMGCAMPERATHPGSIVTRRSSNNPKVHTSRGSSQRLTRTNLPTASRGHCYYCNGEHYIGHCPALEALNPAERFGKVKDSNLCYNCLTPGHATRACQSKKRCGNCEGAHHTILCRTPATKEAETPRGTTVTTASLPRTQAPACLDNPGKAPAVASFVYNGYTTLLATAQAVLLDNQGQRVTVRALCDTGSQITFITERCRLRLKRQKFDMVVAGAGDVRGPTTRGVAILQLRSAYEADFARRINAFVLTRITADLPTHRIQMDQWHHLQGLQLADPNFGNPGEIDLLLGADVWGLIIKGGLINGKANQPHAQNTHLGWVISGPVDVIRCNLAHGLHNHEGENLEAALTRFWQLEEPNQSEAGTQLTDECELHYTATVQRRQDGRYVVSIPFLQDEPRLGDSRRMAIQQFYRNERRIHSDPGLLSKYVAFMKDYKALGHMVLCKDEVREGSQAYYIPHHAVTTKFRVMYNASAKSGNGVSLNETQHSGSKTNWRT